MSINLEQAAQRILTISEQIEALTEEKGALTAAVLTQVEPGTKRDAGDYTISVGKPVQRLSATRIMLTYPVTEHPHLYKAAIDTAAVKKHLAPAVLAAEGLYDESTPRVTIR